MMEGRYVFGSVVGSQPIDFSAVIKGKKNHSWACRNKGIES
jgi:hypothetical protein